MHRAIISYDVPGQIPVNRKPITTGRLMLLLGIILSELTDKFAFRND